MGYKSGITLPALSSSGNTTVERVSPSKATYVAASGPFTPPATPTDLLTIVGNASKIIKILSISIRATQTTAGSNVYYLKQYSSANSGGTSTTINPVALDSSNPTSTAVVKKYTANPTLGTLVGSLEVTRAYTPTVSAVGQPVVVWDYDTGSQGQPITLRSASEQLSVNLNGVALPAGLSVSITVKFTEE